ncbi:glutaredoxin family protein [Tessaracoccus massiliensis]|uniref:glutaredoxin family protein n=1 Tax=Tessaracoccus massiliensis TaxID=1522311 RepID=UPI001FE766D5|nr:glutaredoxin family protein [Tessaracoccus massiliensis]
MLTRDGCHLCVEAEATVRSTCEELGVGWRSLDVDTDEQLRSRFTDHVPVTFVDQELLGYWFVEESALRAALASNAPRALSDDWQP